MRKLIRIFIVLVVFAAIIGFVAYDKIFGINSSSIEKELFIPTGSNFNQLKSLLVSEDVVKDLGSFELVGRLMKFGNRIRPGHFIIPPSISNRQMIQILRSGEQVPINVTISTARKLENIAGIVSRNIEADSVSIYRALLDSDLLSSKGLDTSTAISLIIPNTYEFFWNTDAKGFAQRMKKEFDVFWTDDRESKRRNLDMSRHEVSTLASIVEKESNLKAERRTLAGVYVNRINSGIPLQADPTVVFGIGDFTIRRVLNQHVQTDTPYNTYIHAGLPIGPICMPSISSIDAVLNHEQHDFLFFCAKPGYNNGHVFAETNAQHERNARRYHRWLNKEGIRG